MNSGTASNIDAEIFEENVFISFKQFLEEHLEKGQRNVTVLQGWKRHWMSLQFESMSKKGDSKGEEHDLVILDGTRRLLILFEAKVSIGHPQTLDKALKQLRAQVEYFRKYHGHVLTSSWKIVTVIPFKVGTGLAGCHNCTHFLLDMEKPDTVSKFWTFLDAEAASKWHQIDDDEERKSEMGCYKNLVGRIVGLSSSHKHFVSNEAKYRQEVKKALTCDEAPISGSMPPEVSKKKRDSNCAYPDSEDQVGDERLIFFLSPEQQSAMANKNNLWMVLDGEPGTGKSLLLKIKAWELSKQGKKVAFVIGRTKHSTSDAEQFGYNFYELTLREFVGSGVEVFFAPKEREGLIHEKYLEGYNILWDEASSSNAMNTADFLGPKLGSKKERFFWIVQSPDIRESGGLPEWNERQGQML